jgi:hypothetical protein
MQPVNVKMVTSNVEEVSQASNKTEMLNSATVTFQGQRVQDDDGIILIIIASLQLSFFFCSFCFVSFIPVF